MDALPIELLELILSHFDRRRLLRICSFVCKRWRVAALRAVTLHWFSGAASLGSPLCRQVLRLLPRLSHVGGLIEDDQPPLTERLALPPTVHTLDLTFTKPFPSELLDVPSLTSLTASYSDVPEAASLTPLLLRHRLSLAALDIAHDAPDEWLGLHFPALTCLGRLPNIASPNALAFVARHATQLRHLSLHGQFFASVAPLADIAALPWPRLSSLTVRYLTPQHVYAVHPLLRLPSLRALSAEDCPTVLDAPKSLLTSLTSCYGRFPPAKLAALDALPLGSISSLSRYTAAQVCAFTQTTLTRLTRLRVEPALSEDLSDNFWIALRSANQLTDLSIVLPGRVTLPTVQRSRCAPPLTLALVPAASRYRQLTELLAHVRYLLDFAGASNVRCLRLFFSYVNVRAEDYTQLCDLAFELTRAGADLAPEVLSATALAEVVELCKGNPGVVECNR